MKTIFAIFKWFAVIFFGLVILESCSNARRLANLPGSSQGWWYYFLESMKRKITD